MEKLIQIIGEVLEIDSQQITEDLRRNEVEEWDSLAHIQIIAEIEEQFNIKIPFEEISEIEKISDFLKYI